MEPLEGRQLFAVAVPAGGELLANTTTVNNQQTSTRAHSAAIDANGNSVLVWQSYGTDGGGWGIYGRSFDSAGAPRGPEFRINSVAAGDQTLPAVGMDDSGNFVVAWRDVARAGDADLGSIYARRYNPAGSPVGADFLVNTTTAGDQTNPAVAMGPGGQAVITWDTPAPDGSGLDVYAQRFDASGARAGGEFRANTYATGNQFGSDVAVGTDGRFVVTWESVGQDGDREGIYAQRFGPTGAPQGSEFRVSTATIGRQQNPGVAMDAAGNSVFAWASGDVFSQRFDAAGAPLGGETRVNVVTANAQLFPSVSMDDAGNYVVAWVSDAQDGNLSGIFSRQYNATGVAQTGDVQVNTFTTGEQSYPSVAMDARGNFIAAWQSRYQDGGGWGVYAQRYVAPGGGNTAPVGSAAQNLVVVQDSPATTLSLWDMFADAETADGGLVYSVVSDTNAAVDTSIDAATGTLTLTYRPGASGSGSVVVRATDPGSLHADVTLNVTVTAVVIPPAAPTAVGATAVSARRVDVTWADNSNNESGFGIERSQTGTDGWAPVGGVAAGVTSFGDTGVAPSATYYYRVVAYNEAGASAVTAVMSATTPIETDVTRSYRADDAAVVWGGTFSAPYTEGGRLARGMTAANGDWTAVVNGHSASLSVYAFVADAISITVDGVTTTPALTPNAWQDVPVFSGLADGPHTVTIRNRHTRHQASFEMGRMVTAIGSTPGLSLRPGFSQNIYSVGAAAGVQTDGTMIPGNHGRNANSLAGVDGSFRIRTNASAIKLWMNLATDRVRLSIDGVMQSTPSAVVPFAPGTTFGTMGWYDFATGLDTTQEHEYRLWFHGTGTSADISIVSQMMLVGGTLNSTPPPALPMIVGYGDSITIAQGAPTNHDSSLGFLHRMGLARGMATYNMGVGGSTVHNFGGTNGANGAQSGTARVNQVPTTATDVFVLYGANDAANATIDAATFRADYQAMIAGIRARVPSARIYCINLLPTSNTTIQAKRGAFNAEIAGVVAAAANPNTIHIPTDGIGFDPAIHTYDRLHPNPAGYALLDPYFRSFMAPAGGATASIASAMTRTTSLATLSLSGAQPTDASRPTAAPARLSPAKKATPVAAVALTAGARPSAANLFSDARIDILGGGSGAHASANLLRERKA